MLQAFEEFRACKQERTQLLHSQTQSLSKIEAYADQIEIVINGWEENTLSNNEEIVDTGYKEDTWEEEDIEQVVDTEYGEDAWDVGESITIFEDSRIEEVVLSKESIDCSPPALSSTFETMSSDQMLNLQLQVLPQETIYPTSLQHPYQHQAPPPPQKYSIDFQEKMLQAFEEFRACKQERTQLLHSQTQSLSKIEAYADQIEIVINGWEENTLSNNEEIVDTGYKEDTWEEEDIEQVVDTEYGEDAWDVGESITIFEDSRIEEVVLSKESIDCSPPALSSTFETMSSDQMLNLQLQVLPQETILSF
ncbi:hypothetical protein RHGRI_030430 [Rhododendron griersonianum]|uniref:Uncharacterized protein n=2 Tax=Rhododendron griersonianum TaxID=479676 RepID=A0AAV6INJ6_9ERIC|nr:hypothetical protein RHGRI_030430 [Rhododendron griersonianum]